MDSLYAKWKRKTKAYVKGTLRRGSDALLPSRETREYQSWLEQRVRARQANYRHAPVPGLFSILTPVWNGSPIKYLAELAEAIAGQNQHGACQWVLLDNGCSNPSLLAHLQKLSQWNWVKLISSDKNLGITRGLHHCLEAASGRYVLPVDADDLIFSDTFNVLTSVLIESDYPALLYTDEDKVIGARHYQPYFKPDWDPVLLLNSAYIAHLGVIDRGKALALGAYSDPETEGSPDWDLFVRFLVAGHRALHVPEIVYSWRVHRRSTADDDAVKPFILSSQQKVLERFLHAHPKGSLFELERSPLLLGGAHWHFLRKREQPRSFIVLPICEVGECLERVQQIAEQDGFVCFLGKDVRVESPAWQWEALGITELHPDTVMVGGRIRDSRGRILEAGLEFCEAGICNPNRGRPADNPGYFGQMSKQRTVDAVSTQFSAINARFLVELLAQLPQEASVLNLGAWAGAYAATTGRRVVYTPFLSSVSEFDWEAQVSASEKAIFQERSGVKTLRPSTVPLP